MPPKFPQIKKDDPFFRVLCVDDNLSLQGALKIGLRSYGFEVVTASHGAEALMHYKVCSGNFSSIVTDNEMPEMDGLELIRVIQGFGFKGRIFVMSGGLKSEALRAYLDYGVSGFLHKPFDLSLLAAMLLQPD